MKTSQRGISLLMDFEGFRGDAYLDPIGIPTIGFGFIEGVKMGDKMTLAEAKERLKRELAKYEQGVLQAMTITPSQEQFDACVVFSFNVGVAGFRKSSVLKAHNRGDFQSAARAFGLWNKAGGKVWPGLTRRRAAEAAMYLSRQPEDEPAPMPQRVDEERPMSASTINRAGVVAGGSTAIVAATETVNSINYLKRGVDDLQDWLVPILLIVAVGAVGYIVYQRWIQRKDGWA